MEEKKPKKLEKMLTVKSHGPDGIELDGHLHVESAFCFKLKAEYSQIVNPALKDMIEKEWQEAAAFYNNSPGLTPDQFTDMIKDFLDRITPKMKLVAQAAGHAV
jgi:hypothetical protein